MCNVRASMLPIVLIIVPADSHVGEVERSVQTIKERLRSCALGLPFKCLPRLMVGHMVADTVSCLNQFLQKRNFRLHDSRFHYQRHRYTGLQSHAGRNLDVHSAV